MNADELLIEVYKNGCEVRTGSMEDTHCIYCYAWRDKGADGKPYDEHSPDCLHLAIEAYLRGLGLI